MVNFIHYLVATFSLISSQHISSTRFYAVMVTILVDIAGQSVLISCNCMRQVIDMDMAAVIDSH
jgi:hypothetical protein